MDFNIESYSDLESLSTSLHSHFVMNYKQYGKQQLDGKYKTIYKQLNPSKILHMLETGGSLLTYQESQNYMKWICLDFDIKKAYQDKYNEFTQDLKVILNKCIDVLNEKQIGYLLECSGNRGFHIWIFFSDEIDKMIGFAIVDSIYNLIGTLPEAIAIDCYPKTSNINASSKGLGLGVKLPLSLHKKSNKYSFFIEDLRDFNFNKESWPERIDSSDFLKSQRTILEHVVLNDSIIVFDSVVKDIYKYKKSGQINYIKNSRIEISEVKNILYRLKKCNCISRIFNQIHQNLPNNYRLILVGLLIRLESQDDPNFGLNILENLFSTTNDYDITITKKNLDRYKGLYPPTCSYFKNFMKLDCDCCSLSNLKTPLELIPGVIVKDNNSPFKTEEKYLKYIFNMIKKAQKNYTYYNDEVPLFHFIEAFKSIEYEELETKILQLISGDKVTLGSFYSFKRQESQDKERLLTTLSIEDKILSSFALNWLHSLWYTEFSNNSFGYRFSDGFQSGRIFHSWLTLWKEYIGNVKSILNDEDKTYNDYYVVKIDIRSFYDNIDHQMLRIKLLDSPVSGVQDKLNNLSTKDKSIYYNIVSYLFRLLKKTNRNVGVPQGPAYARYLAEIYLLGLDKVVKDNISHSFEFYYRYVDDVFIFTKTKDRGINILEKVKKFLAINNLKLNSEKSTHMAVKEFVEKRKMTDYVDESKYFIDQVGKHSSIATDIEKEEALNQASVLLNNTQMGIKDHYRFLINQLKSFPNILISDDEINNRILNSPIGRGSLYTTFFDNYYFDDNVFSFLTNDSIKDLNPLARECYLNSLLRLDIKSSYKDMRDYLIQIEIDNCSDTEEISLLSLYLSYNIENEKINILRFKPDTIGTVLSSEVKYNFANSIITDEVLSKLFPSDITIKEYLYILHRITNNNYFQLDDLAQISDYFWKRSFENDFIKQFCINDTKSADLLYNLLSLYSVTSRNIGSISDALDYVWSYFFEQINTNNVDIKKFYWFNNINKDSISELSNQSWSTCITLDQENGLLSHCDDKGKLLDKFREIILALLFDNDEFQKLINHQNRDLSNISDIIDRLREKDLFVDWLYDIQTKLYPNKETCLANLTNNSIIILNKRDEFLVKSLNRKLDNFDYLDNIVSHKMDTIVTFSKSNSFGKVFECFDTKNFFDLLNVFSKLYYDGIGLQELYKTIGYPSYFMDGEFINNENKPIFPFMMNCPNMLSSGNSILNNDLNSFGKDILNNLLESQHSILSLGESSFSYILNKDNSKYFFAPGISTVEDKIKLITIFGKSVQSENKYYLSPHTYERIWAECFWDMTDSQDVLLFLENYINHFKDRDFSEMYYLLFSKQIESINDDKLDSFFDSIISSITSTKIRNALIDYKSNLFNILKKELANKDSDDTYIENIEKIKFKVNKVKTPAVNKFELKNSSNDVVYSSLSEKKLFLLDFTNTNVSPIQIDVDNIDLVKNKESWPIYNYETDYNYFVIIIARQFNKIYEILIERINYTNGGLDLFSRDTKLLVNYEDHINSIKDDIKKAIAKLRHHYYQKENLTEEDIKNKIINWLLLFNEISIKDSDLYIYMTNNSVGFEFLYQSIIEVLCNHIHIDQIDINKFSDNLNELISDDSLIFSLKDLSDGNGLHHLLHISSDPNLLRKCDLDDCCQKVKNNITKKSIVIICDLGISGTELTKAFDYYFYATKNNFKISSDNLDSIGLHEHYYISINSDDNRKLFLEKFKEFENIVICAALLTDDFKKVAKKYFKELNDSINISFKESREISNFKWNDCNIYHTKKRLFNKIVSDRVLLKKIFNAEDTWGNYKDSIKDNELPKTNLILRLKSTPKKRFRLFTMDPKDENIESLFIRRKEHSDLAREGN